MNRPRRPHVSPLLLPLLASFLQFWALDAQSLWYDEGFSVWLSGKPLSEIVALTAADIQPPLYYVLLHGWMRLTGQSEWALRFASALCAVVAVPLTWQVARRLLRQRVAADVAALLVALSPLWLWYGREARNYALGLALLLGAAWPLLGLLRFATDEAPTAPWRRALAVAGLLAAGLYTHYFLLFVLVAWGTAALGWWLRQRRHTLPLAAAFLLPVGLYLPWVGVAWRRLGEDRSYWEGTLSARQVVESALASWVAGHSMHEAAAVPLGLLGGVLAGGGLLALLWRTRAGTPPRARGSHPLPATHVLFLLLWLVGPLLGFLVVAWSRPKYNPRYLLFAAPAFLLCLSALVGWLATRKGAGRLASAGLLLALVGAFALADWNLFTDPAFAKSGWRDVAAFLRAARQPDEPILLVSGHAFPVFTYYYPTDDLVRLPDERTLDTTAVLGLDGRKRLAEALAGARGVWLVNWQDEVVDPEGVVPALLRAAGAMRDAAPPLVDVRLSHWRLPDGADVARALEPTHPLDVRFGGALRLLGWSALPQPAPADEGLSLVLYWAAQQPLDEDLKVRLTVVDEAGFEYGALDQRPTAYTYPTFRWQPGETRLATLDVPLAPGTPPGDYWIELSVYPEGAGGNLDILDAAGAPQGQLLRLGPLPVGPARTNWLGAAPPPDAAPVEQALLDETRLLAVRLALPAALEPGQRVPLTLWWRTGGALPGAMLHLGWQRGDAVVESVRRPLAGAGWPGQRWRAGDLLMTPLLVRVPRDLPAGSVRLVAWLSDAAGRASARVPLASGQVVAAQRSFEPPAVATVQQATFGEAIRLLGYDLSRATLAPGEPLTVTLHWQALAEMETSLTVFVHLLDAAGTLVAGAGQDRLPLAGARLTDSWLAGEFLSDRFTLRLPDDAPPGPYTIEVGWYDGGDPALPRLPARGDGADGNRVLLGRSIQWAE